MRVRSFLAFALVAGGLGACGELFETPVQCRLNDDCARFGDAMCGPDGLCVRPLATPASTPPSGAPKPAETKTSAPATDASTPPDPCASTTKKRVTVEGAPVGDAGTAVEITKDTTLGCANDYLLVGDVYVAPGVTLTIEAGTRVLGDVATRGALYVKAGARLVAQGTADKPIVFTSAQPEDQRAAGDWRGLAILGTAPPSGTLAGLPWGGTDVEADSGVLSFVRVEYAARGLELAGVGRRTVVDAVQVRKSGDNCFSFRGGTVRAKHLLCQYPTDEMFEIGERYDGELQFLVGQRAPLRTREHNGLLVDDSRAVVTNVTLCGSDLPNESFGIVARNAARLSLSNALVLGFGAGFDVQGALGSPLEVRSTSFFGQHNETIAYLEDPNVTLASDLRYDDDLGFDERAFVLATPRGNDTTNPGLPGCFDPAAPGLVPETATAGLTPPSSSFLDGTATYRGAIAPAAASPGGTSPGGSWATASWTVWSAR